MAEEASSASIVAFQLVQVLHFQAVEIIARPAQRDEPRPQCAQHGAHETVAEDVPGFAISVGA